MKQKNLKLINIFYNETEDYLTFALAMMHSLAFTFD